RLRIGYPARADEKEILTQHRAGEPVEQLRPVLGATEVVALQQTVRQVRVEDSLNDYILDLIGSTRTHPDVYLGGSPRAALALYRAAQALALLGDRFYAVPDDIKRLARPVLAHRILAKTFRPGRRADVADAIIDDIVGRTAVPI